MLHIAAIVVAQRPAGAVVIQTHAFGECWDTIYRHHDTTSLFYNTLSDFRFSEYDLLSYNESLAYSNCPLIHVSLPVNMPRNFCPLYFYNNTPQLYIPSDYGNMNRSMLTDSTMVFYMMDGPYALCISSFSQMKPNVWRITFNHKSYSDITAVTITLLNNKTGLCYFSYEMEGGIHTSDALMADASKLKYFPVVAIESPRCKTLEYRFEETDIKLWLCRNKKTIMK